jgi:hypothetical protein
MEIHDMQHCGFNNDKTIFHLINSGFSIICQDYNDKKHKPGFNAKVVFKNKRIS